MKRTQLDRDIEAVRTFKDEMMAQWRSARKYGHTHFHICESLRVCVYEKPHYHKLPRWAKSEISGYASALLDAAYTFLEYRYVLNGTPLTVDAALAQGYTQSDIATQQTSSGYFWIETAQPF